MATTLLGNLTLSLPLDLPTKPPADKKVKSIQFDMMISSSLTLLLAASGRREKEVVQPLFVEFDGKSGVGTGSSRRERGVRFARREGNGNEDEEGFYDDEDDEAEDWREEMRRQVKESEEMKELERKAEELQQEERERSRGEGGDGGEEEESEEEKKLRVRKELEKVAKEQAERRATAQLMFDLGQKAYGRGMYGRAIEFLEAALTIIPRPTLFGGEIQIWLAMAYEANDRHEDCITLYQQLEKAHPIISIRRQASELLYIMQAPKIKITQEEMVTIPLIGSSYDSYASYWTDKSKDKDQITTGSVSGAYPSSRDYLGDILKWKPPVGLESNRAFWAALTIWLGLVGVALFLNR